VAQDREGPLMFQVYRQPLPAAHLHLEDLPDGEPSSSGSFRGAFTGNDKGNALLLTLIIILNKVMQTYDTYRVAIWMILKIFE